MTKELKKNIKPTNEQLLCLATEKK